MGYDDLSQSYDDQERPHLVGFRYNPTVVVTDCEGNIYEEKCDSPKIVFTDYESITINKTLLNSYDSLLWVTELTVLHSLNSEVLSK